MNPSSRVARALLAAAIPCALVAGCGSSSHASHTQTQTTASTAGATTPAAASTATSASTTSPASTAGPKPVAAGTKLTVGQTAIVRYETLTAAGKPGPAYNLRATVESLQQGTLADFKGVQLDASEKAGTPDYVKVSITNLGPGSISTKTGDPAVEFQGVDDTGQNQQSITFLGDFPRCNEASTPNPFPVGKPFETCLTFLIPGGIKSVSYTGANSYLDSPVTWSASGS